MLDKYVGLYNGVRIPTIGFGTSEMNVNVKEIVCDAIKAGYRHIDTAAQYANEEAVGEGIACALEQTGLKREDVFVTGKFANNDRKGYDSTIKAYNRSLEKLRLDYLDLYLIHWPVPWKSEDCYKELNAATWEAMEDLYESGKIKAIGVSNFLPRHIESMISMSDPNKKYRDIWPTVNQIEIHPQFQEAELVKYCKKNNIVVCGWGPFRQGRIFQNEVLKGIAERYKKTVSQIIIRWNLQRDIIPLPKTTNTIRMEENLKVYDFELNYEDMDLIQALDTDCCYYENYSYARQLKY